MPILFAIFAFVYIFNLLPVSPTPKLVVNILGLILLVLVIFGVPRMLQAG